MDAIFICYGSVGPTELTGWEKLLPIEHPAVDGEERHPSIISLWHTGSKPDKQTTQFSWFLTTISQRAMLLVKQNLLTGEMEWHEKATEEDWRGKRPMGEWE